MKNNGIQNKKRFIEITINEDEAKQILINLYDYVYEKGGTMTPSTKQLIQMLEKFENEK